MDNIKDIIKDVIGQIAEKNVSQLTEVSDCWMRTVSPKEAKHCCVSGLKDGTLYVTVDSSMWLFQIKRQQKKLLQKMKHKFEEIEKIYFKIGKLNA